MRNDDFIRGLETAVEILGSMIFYELIPQNKAQVSCRVEQNCYRKAQAAIRRHIYDLRRE